MFGDSLKELGRGVYSKAYHMWLKTILVRPSSTVWLLIMICEHRDFPRDWTIFCMSYIHREPISFAVSFNSKDLAIGNS